MTGPKPWKYPYSRQTVEQMYLGAKWDSKMFYDFIVFLPDQVISQTRYSRNDVNSNYFMHLFSRKIRSRNIQKSENFENIKYESFLSIMFEIVLETIYLNLDSVCTHSLWETSSSTFDMPIFLVLKHFCWKFEIFSSDLLKVATDDKIVSKICIEKNYCNITRNAYRVLAMVFPSYI